MLFFAKPAVCREKSCLEPRQAWGGGGHRLEELLASWERREGAVVDARIRVVTDAKDAWKDARAERRRQCTVLREKLRWSEWMLDRAIGEAADMDVERILTSRRKLREQHTHELWLKGDDLDIYYCDRQMSFEKEPSVFAIAGLAIVLTLCPLFKNRQEKRETLRHTTVSTRRV